jgi:DNA-binding transcriptional ArsR family regulator
MGASNLTIHSQKQINLAAIARVFAHPARVSILQFISKQKWCICEDVVNSISLSQPTISQHLQVIRSAGLLKETFKGNTIYFCLNVIKFKECQKIFNSYFNITSANCC